MNLDTWNKFSADKKAELTTAFKEVEGKFWDLARNTGDADIVTRAANVRTSRSLRPSQTIRRGQNAAHKSQL